MYVDAAADSGMDAGRRNDADGEVTNVTINFDELPDNTAVATQYAPQATFSGVTAFDPGNFGQSMPNFICSDMEQCDSDYTVVFGAAVASGAASNPTAPSASEFRMCPST